MCTFKILLRFAWLGNYNILFPPKENESVFLSTPSLALDIIYLLSFANMVNENAFMMSPTSYLYKGNIYL